MNATQKRPGNGESGKMQGRKRETATPVVAKTLLILGVLSMFAAPARAGEPIVQNKAIEEIKAIEKDIDIEKLGAIAMLDNNAWRYTTVESWARKTMRTMHGSTSLGGLDPVVSAMEVMFNQKAYTDQPVIYVKDRGVLKDLTKHPIQISDEDAERMFRERHVSWDFLARPDVQQRIRELSGETLKNRAMNRMLNARFHYQKMLELFTIIPVPNGKKETQWLSPVALMNPQTNAESGITDEMASSVFDPFSELAQAWRQRDAKAINANVDKLASALPHLAPDGIYPSLEVRHAEQRYRRMGLMRWGWGLYIFAFFISIFALATNYAWARYLGLTFVLFAIGVHGYALWMRWDVLGRIPVANMYEAITFGAWCGTTLVVLLEFVWPKRVFLLASAGVGFFALALPEIVPDTINNELQTMMPILDDAMLRIHTTLIIASYLVIAAAFFVANCYLFVSAIRKGSMLARATIGAQFGALVALGLGLFDVYAHMSDWGTITASALSTAGGALIGMGGFAIIAGAPKPAGSSAFAADAFPVERSRTILQEFDLCHRVLLYIATVSLFVGIVLGAMWADYSWGRPWGWDPKEVFALNTWLIYAILIHARYVTKHRGLWTSVLSVVGFAVMLFNWFVVNFYIVGLHSYA